MAYIDGRDRPSSDDVPRESTDSPETTSSPIDVENAEKEMGLSRTKSAPSIAESMSGPREFLFVAVICLAQFTTQVGVGQALSILHIIGSDLGIMNPGELSWVIAAYSLTVGTFILFTGRLGDLFGYKRMLLIGFSWFALWSLVAGLAVYSNKVLFNFARALQGIGPSILLPNGLAILGSTYEPGPKKNMAFALFGASAPIGSIVGSAAAGLLALAWWPWAFWSFAMTLSLICLVGIYAIPDPPRRMSTTGSLKDRIIDMDLPGAVLGVAGLVLINFSWNQAPIVGWHKAYVIVILVLGFVFLAGFFYNELYLAQKPLIPFDALNADVGFVLACVACGWGCFGIWVYYTWQFFENIRGASPLLASAYFAPVVVAGVLAALFTGWLLGRVHPAWVMTIALAAFTTGTILLATAPIGQTYWAQSFVCMVIIPFGMDMSFPAATVILSNAVKKEHQGIGASLVNTVVNYSISLALGFAGTIEVQISPEAETQRALLEGYRSGFYFAIGLSGLGLVISLVFLAKRVVFKTRSGLRSS